MRETKSKLKRVIAISTLIALTLVLSSCKNKSRPAPSSADTSKDSPKPVVINDINEPINEVESKKIISDEDWLEQWTKESQMNQIQTATKSNEIRDELLNSKYPEVAQVAREKMKQLRQAEAEIKRIAQERRALLEQVNRTVSPEQITDELLDSKYEEVRMSAVAKKPVLVVKSEAELAKQDAQQAGAEKTAGTFWHDAEQLFKKGLDGIGKGDFGDAQKFFQNAKDEYARARDYARNKARVLQAKTEYEAELKKYDVSKLCQYAVETWPKIIAAEKLADSSLEDSSKAVAAYEKAKHLLPAASAEALKYALGSLKLKMWVQYSECATNEMRKENKTSFFVDDKLMTEQNISSEDWQEVVINNLTLGQHQFRVKQEFFRDIVKDFVIRPWETTEIETFYSSDLWVTGNVRIEVSQLLPKLSILCLPGAGYFDEKKNSRKAVLENVTVFEELPVGKHEVCLFSELAAHTGYKDVIVKPDTITTLRFEVPPFASISPTGTFFCPREQMSDSSSTICRFLKCLVLDLPEAGWLGLHLEGRPWEWKQTISDTRIITLPASGSNRNCWERWANGCGAQSWPDYCDSGSLSLKVYDFKGNELKEIVTNSSSDVFSLAGTVQINQPEKIYIVVRWMEVRPVPAFEGFQIKTKFWKIKEFALARKEVQDFYTKAIVSQLHKNSFQAWRAIVWPNSPADKTIDWCQSREKLNGLSKDDEVDYRWGKTFSNYRLLQTGQIFPPDTPPSVDAIKVEPFGEYILINAGGTSRQINRMLLSKRENKWRVWLWDLIW